MNIYYENDEVLDIYFLKKGCCNYVLPRFSNTPFIKIVENTCFGLVDFVATMANNLGSDVTKEGFLHALEELGKQNSD